MSEWTLFQPVRGEQWEIGDRVLVRWNTFAYPVIRRWMISLKGALTGPTFDPIMPFFPTSFHPSLSILNPNGLFPASRASAYVSFFFWLFGNGCCWHVRVDVAAQLSLPRLVSSIYIYIYFYPVYSLENINKNPLLSRITRALIFQN